MTTWTDDIGAWLKGQLVRLRRLGSDDETVEAKACAHGLGKDVWESISAFANTEGGYLLLGIDESCDFVPTSGLDAQRVLNQLVEGMGDGGAQGVRLTNPPEYEVSTCEVDGLPVLVVRIEQNDAMRRPCYITARGIASGSYKRVGDKDLRLSGTELFELQSALVPNTADSQPVADAQMRHLDATLVQALLARRARSRALAGLSTDEQRLEALGVLNAEGCITLAGLLALGSYPQQFAPSLAVDVAVHPDVQKAAPGMPRFLDRMVCEGPLMEAVDQAVGVVMRNLRQRSYVEGLGRREEPELPQEVLREAIANAVIHREYDARFRGQMVSVDVYPDRIEVRSPGGLWGGKTAQNLYDGVSCCRNARLMALVRDTPALAGTGATAEGEGSGIIMMRRMLAAAGLEPPEFRVAIDQFVVVLRRPLPEGSTRAYTPDVSFAGAVSVELSSLDRQVLDLLSKDEQMDAATLAKQLGKSKRTVQRSLARLVSAGLARATAGLTSKARRYLLT